MVKDEINFAKAYVNLIKGRFENGFTFKIKIDVEAAVLRCNPIICYKTSFINYAIISRMLKIDNVGLPNLLLGSRIFPELIQSDCNKQNLMKEAEKMQQGFCLDDYALKLQNLLLGEGFQETAKTIRRL